MQTNLYAECSKLALYAEVHYAECHYSECRYAECRGAISAWNAGSYIHTVGQIFSFNLKMF